MIANWFMSRKYAWKLALKFNLATKRCKGCPENGPGSYHDTDLTRVGRIALRLP